MDYWHRLFFLPSFIMITLVVSVTAQHNSAIDSSFADFGFLEISSLPVLSSGDSAIVVPSLDQGKLIFTQFDFQGNRDFNFGINGVDTLAMEEWTKISSILSTSEGYIICGERDPDSLTTVFVQKDLSIDTKKLVNGVWSARKASFFSHHATSEKQITAISNFENDSTILSLVDSKGTAIAEFGEKGIFKYSSRPSFGLTWLNDSIFSIRENYPVSTIPNASGTRIRIFDKTDRVATKQFFPEQLSEVIMDRLGRIVVTTDGYFLGNRRTTTLRYFVGDKPLNPFPASSEAYAFNWPNAPDKVNSRTGKMIASNSGNWILTGHWFEGEPYKMGMFVKEIHPDGRANRGFGSWGNLFFKKPDLDRVAYHPNAILDFDAALFISFRVSFEDGRSDQYFLVKLKKDQILSIEENPKPQFIIYPNPLMKGQDLFIKAEGRVNERLKIKLSTFSGQILSFENPEAFESYSSLLSPGVYMVRISEKGKSWIQKLIVL